ncbi:MAG: NUDIX domain-containing protein [Candidatus Gracilibacteria bacterium]|jgi:8-oxo-dGTP pyrophosphatase MutT (NUDIX family)|nr:NUDIX domain-containing protein [Candidatus Gracilibacteria bacterium]
MFEMTMGVEGMGGWRVIINGHQVEAKHAQFVHDKYGRVVLGLRPEGFIGWAFFEPGGGGSVSIPFTKSPDGELLIALIKENRANMGGSRWCAIGGYLTPGDTHQKTAERETEEEAGLVVSKPVSLPGLPGCINRATQVANPDEDEGVHGFAIEIPWGLIEKTEEGYKMAPGTISHKRESEMRFFHWKDAIRLTADMLARGAISQLLAELLP